MLQIYNFYSNFAVYLIIYEIRMKKMHHRAYNSCGLHLTIKKQMVYR